MTAQEYAVRCANNTLKELNRLQAKVETGTEIGYELSCILDDAITRVEQLVEEHNEEEE